MENISEKSANKLNGFLMLVVLIALIVLEVYLIVLAGNSRNVQLLWVIIPLFFVMLLVLIGFAVVQPNDSRVLILFGKYTGTVRDSGFWWVNPFTVRKRVSLRIRNFNSQKIKVNDLDTGRARVNLCLPVGIAHIIKSLIPDQEMKRMEDQGIKIHAIMEAINSNATGKIFDVDDELHRAHVEISIE